MMAIFINILIIKKTFLLIFFLFVSVVCIAPATDFRLKMTEMRNLSAEIGVQNHELEFLRFMNDLGYSESRNNWLCINQIGCFGEWQFAESTLRYLGFRKITLKKFKSDPFIFPRELQIRALKALIRVNLIYLTDYEHYIGHSIKGIKVTKSGMIAASHLGGAGSLMKFLDSKGRVNPEDILGTSISDYLKNFSSYDLD
jgi:hypothetical protein